VALCGFDLEQVFCHEEDRVVGKDNTVTLLGVRLQVEKQEGHRTCSGRRVVARRHLSGQFTLWLGPRCVGRYDRIGRLISPVGAAGPVDAASGLGAHKDLGRRQTSPASTATTGPGGGESLAKADNSLVKADRTDHLLSTVAPAGPAALRPRTREPLLTKGGL